MDDGNAISNFGDGEVVAVLTTQPVDRLLDYRVGEGGCRPGSFVEVPLGPRRVSGVVWAAGEGRIEAAKVRNVCRVHDVPPMRAELRTFLSRAADYTLSPLNSMLALAMRISGLGDPPPMRRVYCAGSAAAERLTPARRRVFAVLDAYGGLGFTLSELASEAGVSPSVITRLADLGAVSVREFPRDDGYPPLDPSRCGQVLTADQRSASDRFSAWVRDGCYKAGLLHGVTGSGKTAVYLEAVAECLRAGRQALVLLPEIALTGAFLDQVCARFGAMPAVWHSGVTAGERRRCWLMAAQGRAQLVVGARSALFLPFRDLGLVVVDEEHDSSYKQEDGVIYNGRDMAVLRASIGDATVILASATPSLESWANVDSGKYAGITMPERIGGVALPEMRAVDMRAETLGPSRWISPTLRTAVEGSLERGEQALLFVNRRGYAPLTICRACGHQIGCDQCDARLVLHRFRSRLMCHQCGETSEIPVNCPNCGSRDRLAAVGPGVERLAEEAAELFPDARAAILSSDLALSAEAMRERIRDIAEGGVDIVIGTQIVAKGHNFPRLTTVGVVDADLGLQGGDLRAAERTFQLIHQVSGRAGRDGRGGGVALVQTHQPAHPVIRAILSGDAEAFRRSETAQRKAAGAPPFSRLAGIILAGSDPVAVSSVAQRFAARADILRRNGIDLFGPAPAPVARIRGRHRFRLLARAPQGVAMQPALLQWVRSVERPAAVRLRIDIDPQSFH